MISLSDLRTNMGHFNTFALLLQVRKKAITLFSLVCYLTFFLGSYHGNASNPEYFPFSANGSQPYGMDDNGVRESTEHSAVVDPRITVRFANPQYNCTTYEYCLDVEFQSDTPDKQLFGMNVRFFIDDNILEFVNLRSFQGGYSAVTPNPATVTYSTAGIPWFNFSGGADYVNGAVQKTNNNAPPIIIAMAPAWTKLYQACFIVDFPNGSETNFCPPVVWDLEANPANGGFPNGSAGVVMTVVNGTGSSNALESVQQFNWEYIGNGTAPFGQPIAIHCNSIDCGSCNLLVNNTSNSGAGSLKAAIQCAYSGDTIKFASNLAGANIVVSGSVISLSKSLHFRSNLNPKLKISSSIAGLFEITPNTTVEFKDIDITSGTQVSGNLGAAFRNDGTLKLINSNVYKHPSLALGQYLIRNRPGSTFNPIGSCYIEIP